MADPMKCKCDHLITAHANATPLKPAGCSVPSCDCRVARAHIEEAMRASREAKAKRMSRAS